MYSVYDERLIDYFKEHKTSLEILDYSIKKNKWTQEDGSIVLDLTHGVVQQKKNAKRKSALKLISFFAV